MYEQVTSYLGKLKPAHWKYPENQGDGSDEHPYIAGWPEYDEITSKSLCIKCMTLTQTVTRTMTK